jgi:hypothetical protein
MQFQVLHGGGNLPELTPALGGERPVGVCFKTRSAAFRSNSMS